MKNQIKLLDNLIKIPSPSGFEEKIAEFIKVELLKFLPKSKVKIDFQNNVIASIDGISDKTIIIDAHADTVGFIVTNVDKNGIISVQTIGGVESQIVTARRFSILTNNGIINAVVNRKPIHLIDDSDNEKIEKISEAQFDIGIRGKKTVLNKVKIGDPLIYKPAFYELSNSKKLGQFYGGISLDDKTGCYILLQTIKEIVRSRKKPPVNLIFSFSAQEETNTKARPLVRKYKPDLFIECDVTFGTDYGENLEETVGRCDLGRGIVLYRGVDIDKKSLQLISCIAKKNKIKIQYQASIGNIGYIATMVTNMPTRALIVATPIRNMHTEVEVVNERDLNYGIRLLKEFLLNKRLKGVLE